MAVAQETNRQQVPWESSSLMGDFCFRSEPGRPCAGMDLKALQLPSR
jgi:hypothetical protein